MDDFKRKKMDPIVIFIVMSIIIVIVVMSKSSSSSASSDKVVTLSKTGDDGSGDTFRAIYTFDPLNGNVFLIDTALLTPDIGGIVYIKIEAANSADKVPGKTLKFLINAYKNKDTYNNPIGNLVSCVFGSSVGFSLSDVTKEGHSLETTIFSLYVLPFELTSDGQEFQLSANSGGWTTPCFLGEGLVNMADGSFKRVDELRKGDKVIGGKIKCMIKTDTPFGTDIVRLGKMGGGWTPHHPVRVNGMVVLPHELGETKHENCDAIYNFIMENGDTMFVGGIETYAIGCDQTDFPVKSSFFAKRVEGQRNIMDYYETLQEFHNGYIHTKQENPITVEKFYSYIYIK